LIENPDLARTLVKSLLKVSKDKRFTIDKMKGTTVLRKVFADDEVDFQKLCMEAISSNKNENENVNDLELAVIKVPAACDLSAANGPYNHFKDVILPMMIAGEGDFQFNNEDEKAAILAVLGLKIEDETIIDLKTNAPSKTAAEKMREREQQPENKAKRREREQQPKYKDKKRAYDQMYNQREDVKENRRAYDQKYHQKEEVKARRQERKEEIKAPRVVHVKRGEWGLMKFEDVLFYGNENKWCPLCDGRTVVNRTFVMFYSHWILESMAEEVLIEHYGNEIKIKTERVKKALDYYFEEKLKTNPGPDIKSFDDVCRQSEELCHHCWTKLEKWLKQP